MFRFYVLNPEFVIKYCCDDGFKSFLWSGSRHKISESLNTYRWLNIYFKISNSWILIGSVIWILLFVLLRWNVPTGNAQLQTHISNLRWDLRAVYMHVAYTLIKVEDSEFPPVPSQSISTTSRKALFSFLSPLHLFALYLELYVSEITWNECTLILVTSRIFLGPTEVVERLRVLEPED